MHLEKFAPLAVFLAIFLFRALNKFVSEGKAKDGEGPATDDQTRRVQEEIRRKIAERRGLAPARPASAQPTSRPLPPPLAAPRPVFDTGGDTLRKLLAERVRQREAADNKRLADAVLADEADRAATKQAIAMPAAPVSPIRARPYLGVPDAQVRSASITNLTDDLRDPDRLRRAFVLREILGAPVALR